MIDQKIDTNLLTQAIKVLRKINTKHKKDAKKKMLFEDDDEQAVYLQFSLKKIPKLNTTKMIKINLPHSLFKENKEVCLITGDLDKRNHKAEIEPDVLHYKELLKKHSISNISEVITLRQLRTEYKPYEAKQKLLGAYDAFLADRKIFECLPRVLGRHFFRKRKFPIQITLNTSNLKQQVEKALSMKVFYLTGYGNCCNSEVAYLNMSDEEISENVLEMAKTVCEDMPGSWDNVMGVYLKTALSKAIPIYMSYDDPNKIHLKDEAVDNSFEMDELTTCPNKLVKVYKDGTVRVVRKKRMAETEANETSNVSEKSEKKKKKKESLNDNSELSDQSSLVTTEINVQMEDVKEKPKNKKNKRNILERKNESLINKKSKSRGINMQKALIKEENESLIDTKQKGKQKKRKSLVNNV